MVKYVKIIFSTFTTMVKNLKPSIENEPLAQGLKQFVCRMVFLLAMFGCAKENVQSVTLRGCQTGVINSTRTFLRCCTHKEFLAGSNVAGGGYDLVKYYSALKWETCDQCK